MKLRYKFISGLIFILIFSVVFMNIAITKALRSNMENSISNSLKQIMYSTQEYIRYKLEVNSTNDKKLTLRNEEGYYIVKYISLNYECQCSLLDLNYEPMEGNISNENNIISENSNKAAAQGKAVVDLNYTESGIDTGLAYPIYFNDEYIGIVNIAKSYDSEYKSYSRTLKIINIIEIGIFLVIFVFLFIRTTKITEPITKLTEATKKFSIGEYNIDVNQKGKDEVAILSREFAMMGNKIKEQIEAINAEKAKVDMMEKSRREFFNSVTHELKTPLTAISGYAQLLLSDMVRDKDFHKRALERIYAESERLYNLVLDLIDVSKGLYTANEDFTEVDIKKLITQICTDMNFKAKRYSLNIVNNLCEGTVKVQESKIRQVIINVLDNAIKYSTNGKDIYVNSSISDNKYIIEIVNTSTPIPQDIYENIFEPFVKSKSNSTADSRGMGLFLCKEILNDHDGEISIKNGEIIKVTIALNI